MAKDELCNNCGAVVRKTPPGRMEQRLARVGMEWELVRIDANRSYKRKLVHSFPEFEFRHIAGARMGGFDIQARRKPHE